MGRAPQRAPKQYNRLKPIDLNSTREKRKGAYRNCGKQGHYTKEYRSRLRE